MKTKTKPKILKVFAMCILFLGSSHLMAQNDSAYTQIVCVGAEEPYTLADPITGAPTASYSYQWSITPITGVLGGGTFVAGNSTGFSINIHWSVEGTYTVSVVATDITTGCEDSPIDVEVTVTPLDDATFAYSSASYCADAADPTPTPTLTGGTYSSTAGLVINPVDGEIDLDASTPGTYVITYTTAGTCSNSSTESVTIDPLPTPGPIWHN